MTKSDPDCDNQSRPNDDQTDPFLAALAAAEYDDEPYTEEQCAAAQQGKEAFQRGEFSSLDDVRRELAEEERRKGSSA